MGNENQIILLSWIISACIFFSLLILGGFHFYLVLTNQTTIEFHTNMSEKDRYKRRGEIYRNPYDLGRVRNFQQVFGPNEIRRFRWLLPYPAAKRPVGDGMQFPTMEQLTL